LTGAQSTPALAFVGAGALGQIFAALLAQSGQPVTLLARPATAAQLLAAGSIRLRGAVDLTVPVAAVPAPAGTVGVTADPARLPAGAGLIFLTKGHDLPGAIAVVRPAWPRPGDGDAWVAGFQNGMQKDDLLADAFGAGRVVGGATILSGQRGDDGIVTVTSLGATYLGELAEVDSPRVEAAIAALTRAGIPAETPADIRSVLWSKACNAAGVFGVSVLARTTAPQIFADPGFVRAYLALIRETAAVGAAYGVEVGDYPRFPPIRTYVSQPDEATLAAIPPGPIPRGGSVPSMTQDLLAGRPIEVEGVFGDLVERAGRAGLAVPHLTFVRDLLRGLDRLARENQ
jgi:2-dehydropantoate 2-reductase